MRVLVFHGYLLRGTGSNVYNARLAAALARRGHRVELLTQDRRPEEVGCVDAIGTWAGGEPRVRVLREPVRVTAWRPEIGDVLPVYVADRYEGVEARPFLELAEDEVERYVAANVAAVRDVVARTRPDRALANHLVMGPRILAEALEGTGVPYAVKVHGSALEYTVKAAPERFLPSARRGLRDAHAVLVGSRHTAESLWAAMGDDGLPARTRLGPPGVDVAAFRPRPLEEAAADVRALAARLAAAPPPDPGRPASAFARDEPAVGRALAALDLAAGPHVVFTGKLIVSKGVDLLLAAWPLVLAEVPEARLVVVGFGAYREGLERLVAALARDDLDDARAVADAGWALEGGPRAPLRRLRAHLDGLTPAERAAARLLPERVRFVGRLEHEELAPLLAAASAQVVPSTFPEAFGMVAAEAAACGALPIVAGHSGLAEVARPLASVVPPEAAGLLAYDPRGEPARAIAERVVGWLRLPEPVRARTREALVRIARERYSWEGVADGVVAAAGGELDGLPRP